MPIQIIRADITKIAVDAIVNAANKSLLGGGGVDGAIHKAAGPALLAECRTLCGCNTGEAKITKGYHLSARYVIHTVGPIWNGGTHNEKTLLTSCYQNSLKLALANKCETIAFPLISSGAYGYPKGEALQVAMDTISNFLLEHELLVYIVIFDRESFQLGSKLLADIKTFIDDNYVDTHSVLNRRMFSYPCAPSPVYEDHAPQVCVFAPISLDTFVDQLDESFSQMLLRKIDEAGITYVQCYKKANIRRKLFSKIRSDIHYKPSKPTVLAFAISLELDLIETKELLEKAGFALSHSSKLDLIVEYFIRQGKYNIFTINEALFQFDQSLLGG